MKARAMFLPSAIAEQPRIHAAVASIVRELAPSVVHIRFDLGEDWSGDPAIFFRTLLSDEASKPHNLREITSRVERMLYERISFFSIGIQPYFNYRSQSEQAQMLEPSWA